jgi:hypothetical protein
VTGAVVREEREQGGVRAEAAVRAAAPGPDAQPLAGALAYARLGRRLLADRDFANALAAARAGLEEAGEAPFDPELIDDTEMKVSAAEDRLAEGHPADAAEVMLDVLDIRAELHARAQRADILD